MDSQFLKFWGEFLLKTAEGKRQLEEMRRWVESGLPPSGELAALFRRCYGLPETASTADDDQWRKAAADFHAALKAYAPLWGWVPLDHYNRLKRQKERLETTVAEQTLLIKQFEKLLEDRSMGHMTMITRFQNVIDDQSRAFEKLMQALAPSSETPEETNP